jgi:hypothetical protein
MSISDWRHDAQQDDTRHNDTPHNIKYPTHSMNDTKSNDTQFSVSLY